MDSKGAIWRKLSTIDITPYLIQEGAFLYLPWAKAHILMMGHYPDYSWQFSEDQEGREVHYFKDGTAEVRIAMTVGGHIIYTSQTVRESGLSSAAAINPSAEQIHTAKQRCRVKALAEFGLGFKQLWADPQPLDAADIHKEEKQEDPRDALWQTVAESKSLSLAKKALARYRNAIRNLKLEDDSETRFKELKEDRQW